MKNKLFKKVATSVLALCVLSSIPMQIFAAAPQTATWAVSAYPGGASSGSKKLRNIAHASSVVVTCSSYSCSPDKVQLISFSGPDIYTTHIAAVGSAYANIKDPNNDNDMTISYFTGTSNRVLASGKMSV